MLFTIATALLTLQVATTDTVPPAPIDPAAAARAYLDRDAEHMLQRVRERQEITAREITAYRAVARERISLGMRSLGRERLFYRRELAARIHWRRHGTSQVEVLGARRAVPMLSSNVKVPTDLRSDVTDLAFDPAEDRYFSDLLGAGGAVRTDGDGFFRFPLAPGSEADYAFRSGDTTTIRLPDGSQVKLLELQVLPRRSDPRLVRGSFWFDASNHAPVRAVFRLARAFDLSLDAGLLDEESRGDVRDVPLALRPLINPVRADLRFLTVEYGLWENRWWLPRLIAVDAIAEAGALLPGLPVRFERAYSDYRVTGLPPDGVVELAAADSVITQCPRRRRQGTVQVGSNGATAEVRTGTGTTVEEGEREGLVCTCRGGRCSFFEVEVPADTAQLLAGEYLPPSIFASGETLISGEEIEALTERLRALAPSSWGVERPAFGWNIAGGDLLRYNRVEGLSVGARGTVAWGAYGGDATVRLGVADLEPELELGAERESLVRRFRLAGYRRLAVVDPVQQPFGLGNSLSALLLGRDDGDYYRALGAELLGTPPRAASQWYRWRLFAEQQRGAVKETDFSLPHLLDGDRDFRPNLAAERADQIGGSLQLRLDRGLDPGAFRWGADLFLEGSAGTFGFVRPSLTLGATTPLPGRFLGALELAGGTSFGEPPAQSLWYLGGSGSVRGYAPLSAGGTAFWRARAELGNTLPGARWVLFSDAGWAGDREHLELDPMLLSAGAGISLLDGLVRFDLARALRGERQRWRAELYVNGRL
jgi:hypothetical protein